MALDQVTVQLVDTSKIYGDVTAVNNCNLGINKGELFTLLGPSGSGKTTILRMVAGLIEPSSGRILINGVDVQKTQVHERDVRFWKFGFSASDEKGWPQRNCKKN